MTEQLTGECHSTFAVAISALPIYIEQAKKLSHDSVIAAAGASRTSGVQWTIVPLSQWRETLADLGIDVPEDRPKPPNDIEVQAETYPLGMLVVATVQVDAAMSPRPMNRAERRRAR